MLVPSGRLTPLTPLTPLTWAGLDELDGVVNVETNSDRHSDL
ncbi:MAG: hypothetical protein ABI112_01960 [Terracoccus sp.]